MKITGKTKYKMQSITSKKMISLRNKKSNLKNNKILIRKSKVKIKFLKNSTN